MRIGIYLKMYFFLNISDVDVLTHLTVTARFFFLFVSSASYARHIKPQFPISSNKHEASPCAAHQKTLCL